MCSRVCLLCRGARGHPLPRSCLQQYTHPSVEPMGRGVQESFPNMSWNWSSRAGFRSKPSTGWCPSLALPGAQDRHVSLAGAQVRSSKQSPGNGAARTRSFKAAAEGILSIQNSCLWITYRSQINVWPAPSRCSPQPGHNHRNWTVGRRLSQGCCGRRRAALPGSGSSPSASAAAFPNGCCAMVWGRRLVAKQLLLTEFEPLNGLKNLKNPGGNSWGSSRCRLRGPRAARRLHSLSSSRRPGLLPRGLRSPSTAAPACSRDGSAHFRYLCVVAMQEWKNGSFLFYQGNFCQIPHQTTDFWLTKISFLQRPSPSWCVTPVSV